MAVHSTVAVPLGVRGGLGDVMDVAALDAAGQGLGAGLVEDVLLLHGAPRRALAVVHAQHAGELVHVPYLEQAAARMPSHHGIVRTHVPNNICTYEQIRTAENWHRAHLTPSRAGSVNRQSLVGRPGRRARRMEPSGKTIFFSSSKLCFPGASLQIQHQKHISVVGFISQSIPISHE